MDAAQRFAIFHCRRKGDGYKRIHTKLVAPYRQYAYTEDSGKYCFPEYSSGRGDLTELSRTGRPPSNIAKAASKVLSQRPFSSAKYIAAQLRANHELVERILTEVLGMRTLSLRWILHERTAAQRAQRVVELGKSLRVPRVDAANGFVNVIIPDGNWYDWSHDHSSKQNTFSDLVPT
jgi:hypothetical protein